MSPSNGINKKRLHDKFHFLTSGISFNKCHTKWIDIFIIMSCKNCSVTWEPHRSDWGPRRCPCSEPLGTRGWKLSPSGGRRGAVGWWMRMTLCLHWLGFVCWAWLTIWTRCGWKITPITTWIIILSVTSWDLSICSVSHRHALYMHHTD